MVWLDEVTWAAIAAHEDTALAPPASPHALAAFEAQLGLKLPASHREFLMRANGGVVGYARVFGVGRADGLDLARQAEQMRPYIQGLAEGFVLPFANDWGGSYYCYDRRRVDPDGEWPVLRWNHEYAEEPDDLPMLWTDYAPGFVAFLLKVVG
jgi:hypothetical protein